MVTGPSAVELMVILAPKIPVATVIPSWRQWFTKWLYRRSPMSGGAALVKEGRWPWLVSA